MGRALCSRTGPAASHGLDFITEGPKDWTNSFAPSCGSFVANVPADVH